MTRTYALYDVTTHGYIGWSRSAAAAERRADRHYTRTQHRVRVYALLQGAGQYCRPETLVGVYPHD